MEMLDRKSRRTSSQAELHFLNVKGNSLGGRKIKPDENLDLHKGMKNTTSGKYVGKYKIDFFFLF